MLARQCLSQVFKALADGEEETIQPKRVVPEAKARSPYVPKPPQKQQQKQPQPQGQKRQGKQQGSQSGPKGKKQRIAEQNQSEETSIDGEAEQPPLPSPLDELLIAQQSAGASQDSDIPPPPLPPLQNGHTADSQQPEAMQASDTHSLLGPPLSSASPSIQDSDAPVSFQPRAQVGFKLAGNKRQKLKLEPEEEADPSKSATHAAMRYRLEQAVAKQGAEQQQSKQALSDRSQQASAAQQAAADVPGLADAHADLYSNGQHEALDSHNAVSTSQQKYSWHNSQSQSGMTSQLPPGLQSPDQLPQQLPQQHDLPPGMASGAQQLQEQLPEQLLHQLPGQLPQETSGGGHRRRNRRGRRGAGKAPHTEVLLAGQTGPVGASDSQHSSDFIPSPASTMETSDQAYGVEPVGLASEDMPTQLQQHMYSHEVPHAQQRPHHQQPASMPDPVEDRVQSSRHRFDPSNSPGLADLAESGGAVAIATSSPMGSAEPAEQLQVLADDVKSLLRYACKPTLQPTLQKLKLNSLKPKILV